MYGDLSNEDDERIDKVKERLFEIQASHLAGLDLVDHYKENFEELIKKNYKAAIWPRIANIPDSNSDGFPFHTYVLSQDEF